MEHLQRSSRLGVNNTAGSGKVRLTSQTDVLEPTRLRRCPGEGRGELCNHDALEMNFNTDFETEVEKGLKSDVCPSSEDSSVFLSENLPIPFQIGRSQRSAHVVEQMESAPDPQLRPRCPTSPMSTDDLTPSSLGHQLITMAAKTRDIERQCKTATTEKRQLADQVSKQAQEIKRLSQTVKFLGCQLKSKFQQTYPDVDIKRDQSHAVKKVSPGLEMEVSASGHEHSGVFGQAAKCQLLQCANSVSQGIGTRKDVPAFENDIEATHCSNCVKIQKKETERRVESERQLVREKKRSELLESRLRIAQQLVCDLKQSQEVRPSEGLESHDPVVQDLLTEISVLQQQMVVMVEDFEKERTDRARAVSSRNKLKENFDSLSEKVRVLKRQLMMAHAQLTDLVARNNTLQQTVHQLQSELRTKSEKLAQAVISTSHIYNEHLREPPLYLPMPTVPRHIVPPAATQPADWSCSSCTYRNSGHRTICELCGCKNHFNNRPTPRDAYGYCGLREKSCRLVSRGLSTDEGLSDLVLQDTPFHVGRSDAPASHSL